MINEILQFNINGEQVDVQIKRTNNKNIYLKIKDGNIIVSAPKLVMKKTINKFVSQHIDKFVKHIKVIKANSKYSFEDKYLYLLGRKYMLEINTGFKKQAFEISGDIIFLNLISGTNEETTKYIKKILKELVTEKIKKVQDFWEEQMEVPKHEVSIIYKTTTWGTNFINKRKISYSAKLAHYDEKVLQYLVVHELSHYFEPNHSKAFWDIVRLYIPNYKDIQKILKLDTSLTE